MPCGAALVNISMNLAHRQEQPMNRVALLGAIYLLTFPAFSDGALHRYKGLRHLSYDLRTGEITWLDNDQNQTRGRREIWNATTSTGWFWGSQSKIALDWGDLRGADDKPVTQFEFAYATNSRNPGGIRADLGFYTADDGFDSVGRVFIAGFRLRGLPAIPPDANFPDNAGMGFAVRISIDDTPLRLSGPDLDDPNAAVIAPYAYCQDIYGASDFSYTQRYRTTGPGYTGPLISFPAADPNNPPCGGFGSEDAFDEYVLDPNNPPADPNTILQPDIDYPYSIRYQQHIGPFLQFHMLLWTGEPNGVCPQEGCSTDLDGDCTVALADLAIVLSNFGQTGALLHADFDNDGDVDLTDLALILSEFGNDCN